MDLCPSKLESSKLVLPLLTPCGLSWLMSLFFLFSDSSTSYTHCDGQPKAALCCRWPSQLRSQHVPKPYPCLLHSSTSHSTHLFHISSIQRRISCSSWNIWSSSFSTTTCHCKYEKFINLLHVIERL